LHGEIAPASRSRAPVYFVQQRPTEPTAAEYRLIVRFGNLACSVFGKLFLNPHRITKCIMGNICLDSAIPFITYKIR